jgi:hypothetical protein
VQADCPGSSGIGTTVVWSGDYAGLDADKVQAAQEPTSGGPPVGHEPLGTTRK